jgi:hypothetical protein
MDGAARRGGVPFFACAKKGTKETHPGVARRDKRAPKGLINRAAPNFVLGREL